MTFRDPQSDKPFFNRAGKTPLAFRAGLLGAVALVALAGAASNVLLLSPHAASAQTAQSVQNGPGFADMVQRVRGAVVSVKVKMKEDNSSDDQASTDNQDGNQQVDPFEEFMRRFGQMPNQGHRPEPRQGVALGSGFIISSDGYVVTNNHVVDHATEVTITMDDGKTHDAKIIGVDKKTDLALLKIKDGGDYPFVNLASAAPRVGDWVVAVGNPFGLGGTVTAGIVSARGRDIGSGPYDDYIQIDAPVNRGNSGGPTFNVNGEVIGVNTAIYSPSGGSVGIGFDIPADVVKQVVAQLKDRGFVTRGWIGVEIQPVTSEIADSVGLKDAHGALVADAQKDSPAKAAGIHSGDVVLDVNGTSIATPRDLARTIAALGPDQKADLTIWRDGAEKHVEIKLANMPNDAAEAKVAPSDSDKSALDGMGLSLAPAASRGAGQNGVVITNLNPDSAAAQNGLRPGDVILEVSGAQVSKPADVVAAIDAAKKSGRKAVLLRVKTQDGTRYVALATQAAS
ncbi:Do family serine endopeptidase [Methylovirgula sp. 4M-Z18]|uniref:Do family serine endopeptidase n=1 Tax=Methylovirgula sp. 4M-Z18 TaxID=2293567 RepID=UPI000E2FDC68|nr:Do family serine endopeptidase [Methylovirgula sp. 4M-Z18]RFB76320.1 Do family serine endopeptidase [Methylovirgula sp. 4M-Z18]